MTRRSLHTRYSASAVATMMSTIRSTPLKGGAAKRTRTGSEPFVELWRVTRGDVRVGSHGIDSDEGRNPRCTGIPAVQKPIID